MANADDKGQIFYPILTRMMYSFSLLTIKYCILCLKRLTEVPKYAEMRRVMMTSP